MSSQLLMPLRPELTSRDSCRRTLAEYLPSPGPVPIDRVRKPCPENCTLTVRYTRQDTVMQIGYARCSTQQQYQGLTAQRERLAALVVEKTRNLHNAGPGPAWAT